MIKKGGEERAVQAALSHATINALRQGLGHMIDQQCFATFTPPPQMRRYWAWLDIRVETSTDTLYIDRVTVVDTNYKDARITQCLQDQYNTLHAAPAPGLVPDRRWRIQVQFFEPFRP